MFTVVQYLPQFPLVDAQTVYLSSRANESCFARESLEECVRTERKSDLATLNNGLFMGLHGMDYVGRTEREAD